MSGIKYYRDPNLPIFEIKSCHSGMHASRRHVHEEFSIGVVMNGSSLVSSVGQDFLVKRSSIIMIPPGIIHQCNPENLNHWQFEMLYLKPNWVESLLDTKPLDLCISVRPLKAKDYLRMLRLFDLLQEKFPGIEKETHLITELNYFFSFESYFQQESSIFIMNPKAMRLVREYLQSNFLEKTSLEDLASVSGLNKYHLLRCFKTAYKTSPHAYQTMLRVNYARNELQKRKDEPIMTIAQDAGFYDQSHFDKVFKQYLGTTPLDYRLGQLLRDNTKQHIHMH
jgi:AraC-like DNA-binding protein